MGGPFSVTFSNAYVLNLENNQNVVDTQNLLSVNCFCNSNLGVERFIVCTIQKLSDSVQELLFT